MNTPTPASVSFDSLGIAPKLLDILTKNKFTTPTPIQQQSIPPAIEGKDMIGIAQTGTGKTLAFGIPMLQRLAQSKGRGRGLVVLPTRELALQVNDTLKKIGAPIGLKTAILIGGEPIGKQIRALKMDPHIIIATPGRLIDHLDSKTVDVSKTSVLVMDEADRMLDMGFAPQINKILEKVPRERQTLLFSATMPEAIVKIANSYLSNPLRVEVAPAGSAVKSVTQEIFFIDRNDKIELLRTLLIQYKGSVLVFCRTKFGAKKVAAAIRAYGETSAEIHSNRSLNQRLEALQGFKIGTYRVLVATDIAARGIDVTGIQLVVNYDLPDNAEDYVHRIGRTGRASMTGHAISFATHDQKRDVQIIERLIRKTLPVSKTPELAKTPKMEWIEERPERPRGDRGGRSSSGGRSFGGRSNSDRSSSSAPRTGSSRFGSRGGAPRSRFSSDTTPPHSATRPERKFGFGGRNNANPKTDHSRPFDSNLEALKSTSSYTKSRPSTGGRSFDKSSARSSYGSRPSSGSKPYGKAAGGGSRPDRKSGARRKPFQRDITEFKWNSFDSK